MLDINGQELRAGEPAQLLCEVVEITKAGIRVRVMNSTMELLVGASQDEVLGGLVADSELTAFEHQNAAPAVQTREEADGVAISRFE